MSNSWPSILPTTAPAGEVNDYSGELHANNVKALTLMAQKSHYKPHVLIMPRSLDIGSADKLANAAAKKWKFGANDLTLVVDLRNSSFGINAGADLANKGVNSASIQPYLASVQGRHPLKKTDVSLGISRVLRGVDRAVTRTSTGTTQPGPAAPAPAGQSGFPLLSVLVIVVLLLILIRVVKAGSGTRRMKLAKSDDVQIGDDVDRIERMLGQPGDPAQVPLKEFAKRVKVKNPGDETGTESRDDLVAFESSGNRFLKKKTGESKVLEPSSDGSESENSQQTKLAAFEKALEPMDKEDLAVFAGEPPQPAPELEHKFQKELGDYGEKMMEADAVDSQMADLQAGDEVAAKMPDLPGQVAGQSPAVSGWSMPINMDWPPVNVTAAPAQDSMAASVPVPDSFVPASAAPGSPAAALILCHRPPGCPLLSVLVSKGALRISLSPRRK